MADFAVNGHCFSLIHQYPKGISRDKALKWLSKAIN
jgi:hypothetical protein